jgi:hypothetical protein
MTLRGLSHCNEITMPPPHLPPPPGPTLLHHTTTTTTTKLADRRTLRAKPQVAMNLINLADRQYRETGSESDQESRPPVPLAKKRKNEKHLPRRPRTSRGSVRKLDRTGRHPPSKIQIQKTRVKKKKPHVGPQQHWRQQHKRAKVPLEKGKRKAITA